MKINYANDIAVIGCGRFGQAVIEQLLKLEKNIILIDKEEETVKLYKDDIEKIIIGDAADTKLLKSIRIDKVGTVVVATPDNIEIIAALLELNVKNIITRATSQRHARVLRQIGVNIIIRPEYESGTRAALIAANKNFVRYSENLQEIGDNFVLGTTTIKNMELNGKQLKDLNLNDRGITLVLIKSKGKSIRPTGTSLLHYDDLVTIIGQVDDITSALEWLNKN
ncbi:potassium channel family protein [Mycoplasma leonicaptivi]|uniref:potassium channel family protein n=1 Tax=Mycoplasma leonicaptivi TaxID=36742 RepID=UPI000481CB0F|nr:TrkA family potassium uptake protein [Mycoplasma leonicaptivi]